MKLRHAMPVLAAAVLAVTTGGLAMAAAGMSDVTFSGCLAGGKLSQVQVARAASCAPTATPVQWAGQAAVSTSPSPSPTSASPSPSPTSASPSPSPSVTGQPIVVNGPGSADFYTTQTGFSDWPNHTGGQVLQGINNPSAAYQSQVLTAWNLGNWSVDALLAAGNTAVISYPATQQWLSQSDGSPAAMPATLTSHWDVSVPAGNPGDDYEAAYDLWTESASLYSSGTYRPVETMIWTYNHGQTPSGTNTGNVTISGVSYQLWYDAGINVVSLVMNSPSLTGDVDLLAVFRYLEAAGKLAADTGVYGLSFGFELCSTHGVTETFAVNNLTMLRT